MQSITVNAASTLSTAAGDSIIIVHPEDFERKKKQFIKDGLGNLQIVTDFDRTLTKATVNGKEGASSYGVIENSELLSPEYHIKIREYFNKFYPIEIDPHLSIEEKTPHMIEWYKLANEQLVKERVPITEFDKMITKANLAFRDGVHTFLEFSHQHGIPLLVFSAGIGDLIDRIFVHFEGKIHENMHVVSNRVLCDEEGRIVDFKEPLIHVFNKNEMALSHDSSASWFESVSHRKNMILLGDSPGDIGMAQGLSDPGVVLKVGFLNTVNEVNVEKYKALFDVLILNDGSFCFVNELLNVIYEGVK